MEGMIAQRLAQGCAAMGLALTQTMREQFAAYDALLREANTRMDLTAVLDPLEAVDRHYLDSLTPLRVPGLLPEGARCADVGSGAGFPGIPLAIARPDTVWVLLDAQSKRVGFLREVIAALGLRAEAVHIRAEDAGRAAAHREAYAVAVARAVAGLPVLLELTLPLVAVGGYAMAWKGPAAQEEWGAGQAAARLLGGTLRAPLAAPVPDRDWRHTLVVADKRQSTPRAYPRKAGEPSRRPLGGAPGKPQ